MIRRFGRIRLETSNEDKRLFPDDIRKADLIEYYDRRADLLLPHLRERPLVLQRFPDGIDADGFYQHEASDYFPEWVHRVRVPLRTSNDHQDLVVCDNKASLAYLANQACIALHTWQSRRTDLDRPDLLIVDLDPPEDLPFDATRQAALWVRDLLREVGLVCFPKLTGSRGIHVTAPLDRSGDFDEVRTFARDAMDLLAERHPTALTTEQRRSKRGSRIYLDTTRNAYGQTAVAPWSVRALPGAPVAAPVSWHELEHRITSPRDYRLRDLLRHTPRRIEPWRGFRRRAHALHPARKRLDRVRDRRD